MRNESMNSGLSTPRLTILGIVLAAAAVSVFAQTGRTTERPYYLEGVDLDAPSQAAFEGWPPDELRQRPYWMPWMPTTFARASTFDRPVFFVFTVGWNHGAQLVGSTLLQDPGVLEVANAGYVSILENADRRPDLAARYSTGGWPVMALLTADGYPMITTANERKTPQPITIGRVDTDHMRFLLSEGSVYHHRRGGFLRQAGREWAAAAEHAPPEVGAVDDSASDALAAFLLGEFDVENGGFGVAPKHVVPGLSEYAGIRTARQVPALRGPARDTLQKLVEGPLYDREHGGIHRMAAAPEWSAIQYEKLLDRNANLLRELLVSMRWDPVGGYPDRARETASFLVDVLGRGGGGFYLAQSADPASDDGGGYWRGEGTAVPPRDSHVIAGPNVRAAAALLRAADALDEPRFRDAAVSALAFVIERGWRTGRGVGHVLEPRPEGYRFLVTQADVAFFLLDAYETTGDGTYLAVAKDIADFSIRNLLRPDEPAMRDHLETADPAGLLRYARWPVRENARMARALLRLTLHGQGDEYRERALTLLGAYADALPGFRVQGIEAALGIEEAIREPLLIEIRGGADSETARALRSAATRVAWPWTVVTTAADADGETAAELTYAGKSARAESAAEIRDAAKALTGGVLGTESQ